jgi:hypothetical protein
MEAASSATTFASPARQQYHPSAAKAWVSFNGTGTPAIIVSYNCSSITDSGVGDWTVNFTTSFSSASFAVAAAASTNEYGLIGIPSDGGAADKTASSCRIRCRVAWSGAFVDVADVNCAFYGDQ